MYLLYAQELPVPDSRVSLAEENKRNWTMHKKRATNAGTVKIPAVECVDREWRVERSLRGSRVESCRRPSVIVYDVSTLASATHSRTSAISTETATLVSVNQLLYSSGWLWWWPSWWWWWWWHYLLLHQC